MSSLRVYFLILFSYEHYQCCVIVSVHLMFITFSSQCVPHTAKKPPDQTQKNKITKQRIVKVTKPDWKKKKPFAILLDWFDAASWGHVFFPMVKRCFGMLTAHVFFSQNAFLHVDGTILVARRLFVRFENTFVLSRNVVLACSQHLCLPQIIVLVCCCDPFACQWPFWNPSTTRTRCWICTSQYWAWI